MADEPQVPAQPEGASQPTKKKSTPVNLAVVEAAERGLDLCATPPPKKAERAAKAAPPPPAPAEASAPATPEAAPAPVAAPSEPALPSQEPPSTPDVPEVKELRATMEANADQPAPEGDEAGTPREALESLASSGNQKRLSPAEEDRATLLLRTCLASGEIAAALAAMPKFPWILGVRGIEQAWPQLDEGARADLLNSLATLESEHAIRLRLSVARSLARLDPPVGIQLAGAVCRTMWDAEKGALSPDHSKLIGNVFIGRGKPWVLQLALKDVSPEDADAIISCVVFSAFNVNNPPITQLSVLRYAGARLGHLHPNLLNLVAKGISRWSGKWQESLRKEVPELPEAITAALKSGRAPKQEQKPANERAAEAPVETSEPSSDDEGEIPLPPQLEEKLKCAIESGDPEAVELVTSEINAWRDVQASAQQERADDEADRAAMEPERRGDKRGRRGRGDRGPERDRERKERPAYVSREQEAASKGGGPFNLNAALKQIENHVAQLRNELGATQAKLRKAETSGPRRSSDKVVLSVEEANLSTDELKRLIVQLEQRNAELQSRVEELLADSETRALATSSDNDVTAQYRTLLKLKLQEDYSDYLALETNSVEFVVQQHYRGLIRHVFGILLEEGITLAGDLPPPPPPPLPPPPPPPVLDDEEDEEESSLDRIDQDPEPDAEQAEAESPDEGDEAPEAEASEEPVPSEDQDPVPTEDDEPPKETPRA